MLFTLLKIDCIMAKKQSIVLLRIKKMNNITVLASGKGSTFQNLINVSKENFYDFEVNALITNNSQAGCVDIAIQNDVTAFVCKPEQVWHYVPENTNLVVLAGYLKLLKIPDKWKKRVLNIHPSLLPKHGGKGCYGIKVQEKVIEENDHYAGCTVHIVDNEYDHGKIIQQETTVVRYKETPEQLEKRIKEIEKTIYPMAIHRYLEKLKYNL